MPKRSQSFQSHLIFTRYLHRYLDRDHMLLIGIILFLIIVASAFRFYKLGKESLWYDETYSWWCIDKPWIDMFNSLRNPGAEVPLFYIVVKLTTLTLKSTSEWVLRLPSALAGVMGVIIAMMIGYLSGGKAGLLAGGWFWTIHPMTIWYSRDVKSYSLNALLAGCVTVVYLLLLRKESKFLWFLASVLLTLGLLSHYYFFLLVGSLLMIAFSLIHELPLFFRKWTLITLVSFIPIALWVIWFLSQPSPMLGSGWIIQPDWNDPFETMWNFLSGYAGQNSFLNTVFGIFIFFFILNGLKTKAELTPSSDILFFGLGVPIAGMWIISRYRSLYVDRYFIVLMPYVTILISRGAKTLSIKANHAIRTMEKSKLLLFLLILIPSITGFLVGCNTLSGLKYRRESWRDLYSDLSVGIRSSRNIWLSDPYLILPLNYYFDGDYKQITSIFPPVCKDPCWWILRQNFTYTHAFTQSINPTNRSWIPEIPEGCNIIQQHNYRTGIMLWLLQCH